MRLKAFTLITSLLVMFWFHVLLFTNYLLYGAPVPYLLNYQGRLTDKATGVPKAGVFAIEFSIWDAEKGGNRLWYDTYSVSIPTEAKGVFHILLGSGANPLTISFDPNKQYWLQLVVGGELMEPRTRIVSVMHAVNADMVGGYKIQAGQGVVSPTQATDLLHARVSFPQPFQNEVLSVVVTPGYNYSHQVVVTISGWTRNGFDAWFSVPNWGYSPGMAQPFHWIAIGY